MCFCAKETGDQLMEARQCPLRQAKCVELLPQSRTTGTHGKDFPPRRRSPWLEVKGDVLDGEQSCVELSGLVGLEGLWLFWAWVVC